MYLGDSDLLPGEKLLWSGSPKRRRFFEADELLLLPVLVVWIAFAFVGIRENALSGGLPIFFVPFALIFCGAAFGRPLLRYLKLGRTTYLVTDQRVVARTAFLGAKERSEYLTELAPPVVKPAADGTGTITFGELSFFKMVMARSGARSRAQPNPPMLLVGIQDPKRVRDLIATGAEAARRHRTH
jgi:hypothetical protein